MRMIFAILVFLSLAPAWTVAAGAPESARRVCVYDFTNYTDPADEGTSAAGTYSPLIADSLALELERAGYLVVAASEARAARGNQAAATAIDQSPGEAGEGDPAEFELASSLGADVLVTGSFRLEGGRLYVLATAWDLFSSRAAVGLLERGDAGTAVFETIDEIARKVAEKARSSLRPLTPAELVIRSERVKVENRVVEKVVELGKTIDITLRSPDEGAEVWIGDSLAGRIERGELVVRAKAYAPLAVRVRGKGLRDGEEDFLVSDGRTVYQLKSCYRRTVLELGASYSTLLPLGISASGRMHIVPDILWLDLQVGVGTGTIYTEVASPDPPVIPGPPQRIFQNSAGALILVQYLSFCWYPFQNPQSIVKFGPLMGVGNIFCSAPGVTGDELFVGILGLSVAFNAPRWTLDVTARTHNGMQLTPSSTWAPGDAGQLFAIEAGIRWKF